MTEYAPKFENNTAAYIQTVCKDLKVSADGQAVADQEYTLRLLVHSISRVENGGNFISNELFEKAYAMI
jgi:hypothetical protein